MDGVVIHISWEYFLGIVVALICVAWYSGSRFTALETSMQWVKDTLNDLKVASDNAASPAYASHSPVNLNDLGKKWLEESGLKDYITKNQDYFLNDCKEKETKNPYEVQKHIFRLMDQYQFDLAFDDKLKKFAFDKGTSTGVLRRIGAIEIRNRCLESLGMNKDDIDIHDPEKVKSL